MDNKCPAGFKKCVQTETINYQLVPLYYHRNNPAEKGIGTWKEHFLAGICSTDSTFLLHFWDRLVSQYTIMLNPLQSSSINPNFQPRTN